MDRCHGCLDHFETLAYITMDVRLLLCTVSVTFKEDPWNRVMDKALVAGLQVLRFPTLTP